MAKRFLPPGKRRDSKWPSRRLYVLWAPDTGFVKIGIAASAKRLHDVYACCPLPLVLIGTRPGTLKDESRIHHLLRRFRTHGEWFELPMSYIWGLVKWVGYVDLPSHVEVSEIEPVILAPEDPLSLFALEMC